MEGDDLLDGQFVIVGDERHARLGHRVAQGAEAGLGDVAGDGAPVLVPVAGEARRLVRLVGLDDPALAFEDPPLEVDHLRDGPTRLPRRPQGFLGERHSVSSARLEVERVGDGLGRRVEAERHGAGLELVERRAQGLLGLGLQGGQGGGIGGGGKAVGQGGCRFLVVVGG